MTAQQGAQDTDQPFAIRVAVLDAHLEFLIDGDGDWFATLEGVVEHADNYAIATGLPMDIRLGDFDPTVWGLHIAPDRASATAAGGEEVITALKALLAQSRPQGPSLKADIKVSGEPEIRASGLARSWWLCDVTPMLTSLPQSAASTLEGPDFDADLRIAVSPESVQAIEAGGPAHFYGPVIWSRHEALIEGLEVNICFAPDAKRGFFVEGDSASVSWPVTALDEGGILETLELARKGPVFIDLDLGQTPSMAAPGRWHLTDIAIIAAGLLSKEKAAEN